ncbi:MAG: HAD family phosphatase [Paludibacteraceae bacterium]|nr:HAD family phosphatase [Paludibacteraceae bacterium]
MIKNLLFDFGGVIIDADLEAASARFRALGMENISDYLNLYRQKGIFLDVEEGHLDRQGFNDAFRKEVGKNVSDEDIESAWLAITRRVNVDKLQWIEAHRNEYHVFLLSNINPYVFEQANTSEFSSLGKPLSYYFDKMFASYQMKLTKPGVEIFQQVISEAPLNPRETLFVDDGPRNIETGKTLGFITYQPQNGENWIPSVEKILFQYNGK